MGLFYSPRESSVAQPEDTGRNRAHLFGESSREILINFECAVEDPQDIDAAVRFDQIRDSLVTVEQYAHSIL